MPTVETDILEKAEELDQIFETLVSPIRDYIDACNAADKKARIRKKSNNSGGQWVSQHHNAAGKVRASLESIMLKATTPDPRKVGGNVLPHPKLRKLAK